VFELPKVTIYNTNHRLIVLPMCMTTFATKVLH